MSNTEKDKRERMKRFADAAPEAIKAGCGGREVIQIGGGPYVACPGCKDCVKAEIEPVDEWCKGSSMRVKLATSEQISRTTECIHCGRVLAVRLSEREGAATLPRHYPEEPKR